jgi:hypothetical protein
LAEIVARLQLEISNSNPGEVERMVVDAARLDALVNQANPAQKRLLQILAAANPNGVYAVPSAAWVEMILSATADISEADLNYLATLEWEPARTNAEALRAAVRRAIARRTEARDPSQPQQRGEGGERAAGTQPQPPPGAPQQPVRRGEEGDGGEGRRRGEAGEGEGGRGQRRRRRGEGGTGGETPARRRRRRRRRRGGGREATGTSDNFVEPSPYRGEIRGSDTVIYITGLPERPQVSRQSHFIMIAYRVEGRVYVSEVPCRVTRVTDEMVVVESTNREPLSLAPEGIAPEATYPVISPRTEWQFTFEFLRRRREELNEFLRKRREQQSGQE